MTIELAILLAVAVLALPHVLLSWRRSWFAYVLCMSATGLMVQVGPVTIRPEHLGVLFLAVAVVGMRRAAGSVKVDPLVVTLFALWLAFGLIASLFQAPEPVSSLYMLGLLSFGVLSLFVVRAAGVDKGELVAIGTKAVAIVSTISVAAWAIGQATVSTTLFSTLTSGGLPARVNGLAFEPNIMGAFLCLWIVVMLRWREESELPLGRYLPIIVIAAILTMTRGVWIALVVLLLLELGRRGSSRLRVGLVAASVGAVLIYSFVPFVARLADPLLSRATGVFNLERGTAGYRITSWETAMNDIVERGALLTGLGVNSFSQRHSGVGDQSQSNYLSNAWLGQLYDFGLIGLLLLFAALVLLFFRSADRPRTFEFLVALGVTAALTNSLWFVFPWALLGLVSSPPNDQSHDIRARTPVEKVRAG